MNWFQRLCLLLTELIPLVLVAIVWCYILYGIMLTPWPIRMVSLVYLTVVGMVLYGVTLNTKRK